MTDSGGDAVQALRGGGALWVLAALVLGLLAGIAVRPLTGPAQEAIVSAASMIGGFWLDALKMTVVPLIVSLLVVGIARGAEAARAGRVAARAVLWFVLVCTSSAVLGALLMPLLTGLFPLEREAAEALRAGLAQLDPGATQTPVPGVADFFREIVPDNVVAAASNGDVLQLVIFSVLFALAASRLPDSRRRSLVGFFEAIADALLVIIGWVLLLAPVGVFALGLVLGASAGGEAFAGLLHYILLVSAVGLVVALAAYPIAIGVGRVRPAIFTRAMLAPQSVAISTRSSLASLPAMLTAVRAMGIRDEVADVSLPMAVALFRATGPAMNVAVAFYVAHWLGLEPSLGQVLAATAVGAVISYGAISLPGEVSFFASIAPIAMALGVPLAPLALLVAVEMVPDIMRTFGNVSMDVAVTAAVDRQSGDRVAAAD